MISRAWKVRIIVYGTLLLGLVSAAIYCTWMPGSSAQRVDARILPARQKRAQEMRLDVEALVARGPRNLDFPQKLRDTEQYLSDRLARSSGRAVKREIVETPYGDAFNLYVELPGRKQASEWLIVGAHYDTAPGTAGANDNGSGVALLLQLVDAVVKEKSERSIRFVLFANEEPPHFQTDAMGSLVHARASKRRGERVVAMVSLESLGCYSDSEKSQKYPPPVGLFYPSRGNFVALVSNLENRELVTTSLLAFRRGVEFPSEGGVFPAGMPGIGWSDHWAFWQVGIPALMMTDTAPFRDPHYHTSGDTVAHLDFDKMALVFEGANAIIKELDRKRE